MITSLRSVAPLLALSCSLAACGDDRSGTGSPDGGIPQLDPRFETCATAVASTKLEPAYLEFVLDGSNSMMDDHKWEVVVPAMKDFFDKLGQSADSNVAAGLIVFADSLDPTGAMGNYGPYPQAGLDVPIDYVSSGAPFSTRLDGMPMGITPIQESLTGAYAALHAYQPSGKVTPGGRKIVVLLTDGFPFSSIPSDEQVANSLAAAQAALTDADPISTFVVGIGSFPSFALEEFDPTFLGRLAVAGGTRRTSTCNPTENDNVDNVCYFQVTPTPNSSAMLAADFAKALEELRRDALACDFVIGAIPNGQTLNPAKVNVSYISKTGDTQTIAKNPNTGWSYDNPSEPSVVRLNGKACDDFRTQGGKISIVLGCDTLVL